MSADVAISSGGTTVSPVAPVVSLDDPTAVDPAVTGAKAANLARAASAGLPVLPGFALTTGASPAEALDQLRAAWSDLGGQDTTLVVRSSSTAEDLDNSSMAGQFTSVVGVVGWPDFVAAIDTVLASGMASAPMAVLVQPQVRSDRGGVLFGVDPVTGNRRRLLVEAVPGLPHDLVSGSVTATRYLLSRHGRLRDADPEPGERLLDLRRRWRLAALARRAERVFGSPQDIEWAEDDTGRLRLLQSRPVTATGHGQQAIGPLLGPGPVAETFPAQLRPLEEELWITPMRAGIAEALSVAGAAPRRQILASPVIAVVDGWAAVDLQLLGYAPPYRSWLSRLDPSGPLRHLTASWQTGRLRVALPDLARDLIDDTDVALHEVPEPRSLGTGELVEVLDRARAGLMALHAYEVLAGMLLDTGSSATAARMALQALGARQARGHGDDQIIASDPVVLALTAPRIGARAPLPEVDARSPSVPPGLDALGPREALRLRIRWVQELAARVALELGRRPQIGLADPQDVSLMTLSELRAAAAGDVTAPTDLATRRPAEDVPPLPAVFRLTRGGDVTATATASDGHGAGGGRSIGPVRHEDEIGGLLAGEVLIVRSLAPELAPYLDQVGGLVSETGSVLSHLAILAREQGVPTVVGVAGALERFPSGLSVLVDGTSGTVERVGGRS